jgi:hypothetical protein
MEHLSAGSRAPIYCSNPHSSSGVLQWRAAMSCGTVNVQVLGARGLIVPDETLAQFAGRTVAAAAITDAWESVHGRFARLLGCGDPRRTEVALRRLAKTREQLASVGPRAAEQVRHDAAERWAGRFADLLEEDPSVEVELRGLTEEVVALLPAGVMSTSGSTWTCRKCGFKNQVITCRQVNDLSEKFLGPFKDISYVKYSVLTTVILNRTLSICYNCNRVNFLPIVDRQNPSTKQSTQ